MRKKEIVFYGNTTLERCRCGACKQMAFVIDNQFQCCGGDYIEQDTGTETVYEVRPEWRRKGPSKGRRKELLEQQENKCIYCGQLFGTYAKKKRKTVKLQVRYDHFMPYCSAFNNKDENYVAACNICNGIKADKSFDSIEAARDHIMHRIYEKGIKYLEWKEKV